MSNLFQLIPTNSLSCLSGQYHIFSIEGKEIALTTEETVHCPTFGGEQFLRNGGATDENRMAEKAITDDLIKMSKESNYNYNYPKSNNELLQASSTLLDWCRNNGAAELANTAERELKKPDEEIRFNTERRGYTTSPMTEQKMQAFAKVAGGFHCNSCDSEVSLMSKCPVKHQYHVDVKHQQERVN